MLAIGLGNRLRRDDAAGIDVIERVRERAAGRLAADTRLLVHEGDGLALLELWRGARAVVLVDAIESGSRAGEAVRFDASAAPVPARTWASASTHAIGAVEAIDLARVLARLPAVVVVHGIVGEHFDAGEGLSDAVAAAVPAVAEAVLGELASI